VIIEIVQENHWHTKYTEQTKKHHECKIIEFKCQIIENY